MANVKTRKEGLDSRHEAGYIEGVNLAGTGMGHAHDGMG
jgi:hypothetical protein